MKPQVQKKPVSDEEHQKMIRSVAGTMAIEGLTMRERTETGRGGDHRPQTVYADGIADQREIHQDTAYEYPPLSVRGYLSVCRTYPP